jgi:hypothetical protein
MKKTELSRDSYQKASFKASRRQKKHNEVSRTVTEKATVTEPDSDRQALYDEAAMVRAGIHRMVRRHTWKPAERKQIVKAFTRDYLPLLAGIRDTIPTEQLQLDLDQLDARLSKGWAIKKNTPLIDRHFQKLLTHYEVIADALKVAGPPTGILLAQLDAREVPYADRIQRWKEGLTSYEGPRETVWVDHRTRKRESLTA